MNENQEDTVYFHLDPSNPPTMSEEQMQALRELRDEDIDYSDIPPLSRDGWKRVAAKG